MIWLDTISQRYGRLPSEVMALPPHDYAFCEYVAYRSMHIENQRRQEASKRRGR